MAKHSAPTAVTIADTEERGLLHQWVDKYWKSVTVVTVIVVGLVLYRQYQGEQRQAAADSSWDALRQEVNFGSGFTSNVTVTSPEAVARLAEDLATEPSGPWAKALEVQAHVQAGEYEAALGALTELEQGWPDHPLLTESITVDDEGTTSTLPAHLRASLAGIQAWEAAHPNLFSNPALPEGSPRVRINTDKGAIVVGLYQEMVPRHVENFLKLCGEGYYDGTLFHRVIPGFMIQGGDPNSRDGDPATWGQGGPDYTVDDEFTELAHFKHVLSAAKTPGATASSGSQFFITTGEPHHLDRVHTVFGAVLEGDSVIAEIESGPVTGDRPQDPVKILGTEIL
jgi:peptidyl-prolyl cis-trans isomerase B (cyclophilin B)